jgi:hypothetical protein
MRMLIIAACVSCGALVYLLAYWLASNDQLYKRVFFSSFGIVARFASVLIQFPIWLSMAAGLLFGLFTVAVHAKRWLVGSLLFGFIVFFLWIFLLS